MELGFVPPIHPLKRRDLHLDNVCPPSGINELILIGTVDVLGQGIVIGIANGPSGFCDSMLGKTVVMDEARILRTVVRIEPVRLCAVRTWVVWFSACSGNA